MNIMCQSFYIVYAEVVRRFLMFLFGFWNMNGFYELLIFVIFLLFFFSSFFFLENYTEELTRMNSMVYSILFNYRACIAKSLQFFNTSVYDFSFFIYTEMRGNLRIVFVSWCVIYISRSTCGLFKEHQS